MLPYKKFILDEKVIESDMEKTKNTAKVDTSSTPKSNISVNQQVL